MMHKYHSFTGLLSYKDFFLRKNVSKICIYFWYNVFTVRTSYIPTESLVIIRPRFILRSKTQKNVENIENAKIKYLVIII